MTIIKQQVLQTTPNQTVFAQLPTLLTVDGKQGWKIVHVAAHFVSANFVSPLVDTVIDFQLNTETGIQGFADADNICNLNWRISGIAASTSAFQLATKQEWSSDIGRLTVQPILFMALYTEGLTAAAYVNVEVEYELVRLSDMEVMRLLQGGA